MDHIFGNQGDATLATQQHPKLPARTMIRQAVNHLLVEGEAKIRYRFLLKVVARGDVLTGSVTSRWLDMLGISRLRGDAPVVSALPAHSSERDATPPLVSVNNQHLQSTLLDLVPSPAWIRGPGLDLTYVNKCYALTVGSQDLASALFAQKELGAGQLGANGKALAKRVLRTEQEQTESISVVINGARRLFQVVERPDGNGGTTGVATDMTALDEAQSQLASHMSAHQEVLEQLRAGIAVFDGERRLRFVNRAYADMWGLDHSWLKHGPTLNDILERLRETRNLPEVIDFSEFRRLSDQRFSSVIAPQEQLVHLPDTRCFREICAPHPLGGLLFVFEDVTDRLALERSYNTLIDVQRGILDQLADGIAAFGTDGRLSVCNPSFERLTANPPSDMDGKAHLSAVLERFGSQVNDAELWQAFCESAQRAVNSRDMARHRTHLTDGRTIDLALGPLADGSALMTVRDVTDTYNVERVLIERNAALEETNRLKTDFLANASYELRTPLTTISGFAELLAEGVGGSVTDQQKDYLHGILKASGTLTALIDSILDVSPGESGQLDMSAAEIALAPLLNSVVEVVRPQIESKGATFSLEITPALGTIQADERRLRQLVFNLLSSTARLTANRAAIEVRCSGDSDTVLIQATVQTSLSPSEVRAIESELTLTLVQRLTELHGGQMDIAISGNETVTISCELCRKRPLQNQ